MIDGLASILGYLEASQRASHDLGQWKTGFQSRMRATPKMIDLIDNYSVAPSMIALEDGQLIILRDADKESIPYEETDETSAMEATLRSYNAFLSKYELDLSLPTEDVRDLLQSRRIAPIDFTRNRLYRIFNEDFTSGGRFYQRLVAEHSKRTKASTSPLMESLAQNWTTAVSICSCYTALEVMNTAG